MPTIPLILIEGHMTIAMDSIQFLVHYLLQVDMVKWVKLNVMICTYGQKSLVLSSSLEERRDTNKIIAN